MADDRPEHGEGSENGTQTNRRQLLGALTAAGAAAGPAGRGGSSDGSDGSDAVTEPDDPLSAPTGAV
jgi:nitrous oxide reductase